MFSKVFDSIAASLSSFVLGWAVPSAVTVGIFGVFLLPLARDTWPYSAINDAAGKNEVTLVGTAGFFVLTLAVLFAYTHLPIYRILEGYTIPACLKKRLHRRQLRNWQILDRFGKHPGLSRTMKQLGIENRLRYPEVEGDVQATSLGNAMKALETYGSNRFGLDSQTLWYELLACAPQEVRRDVEQTRGAVDIFVSSVAHFTLLALVSFAIALTTTGVVRRWQALAIGIASLLILRPAYNSAVRNVLDYRYAIQALVHTGRVPLANHLGFRFPRTGSGEWRLWWGLRNHIYFGNQKSLAALKRQFPLEDGFISPTGEMKSPPR